MLAEHFRTMARYNAWANETVYGVVAAMPAAEVRRERPAAFFGSIHGTLNHLLLVDRLWFGRVAGAVPRDIVALDQILHDDLAALRAARAAEDARILAQVDGLDEAALGRSFDYRDMAGRAWTMTAAAALATVFNHQTHHRGQVHALIKDAGFDPPPLDLPVYLRRAK